MKKRVIIADDHLLLAEGIRNLIEQDYDVVAMVEDGLELVKHAKRLQPDIILSDISMPNLNGIDAIPKLRENGVEAAVIIMTMFTDIKYAVRAFDAGAKGYFLKNAAADELHKAINTVLTHQTYITPTLAADLLEAYKQGASAKQDPLTQLSDRQRQVLQLLAEGYRAKEIAAKLNLSSRTVEFHKYKMIETLHLNNARELIRFAIENGLVNQPQ